MYAARFRLISLNFRKQHEEKIQRSCIIQWRDVVQKRSRVSQISERASVLYRFMMGRRSFHQWVNFVLSRRILENAFERTSHIVRLRQCTKVLDILQNHCQFKMRQRQQRTKAERFRILNLLRRSCSQWYSLVHKRASKEQMNMIAYKKWATYKLRFVLGLWKSILSNRGSLPEIDLSIEPEVFIHQACREAPEDPVIQAQILTKFFWCWFLLVSQKKVKMDKFGDKSMILAERHFERNLQRAVYDGWSKSAFHSCLTKLLSQQTRESDMMCRIGQNITRKQSDIFKCTKRTRRVWGSGKDENPKAQSELLKQKYCGTSSRRVWIIGKDDYAEVKSELLKQISHSTGSRKVWITGQNDYAKARKEILKLMYCSKPSGRELAVSWFVKSLAKRFLDLWRKQVVTMKRHRQNRWYAVVHSKMQYILKGFCGLRENIDAKHIKQSLQDLSLDCYYSTLKRKTVNGCKLLHQTKRVKLAQIEHVTSQWRTVKLQERFEQWHLATALRSKRRKLQQKSLNFWKRQMLVRAFQGWYDVRGIFREKENLQMIRLTTLRRSLSKSKMLQILASWKSFRKDMNIKRFNEASALQFFSGFRAATVFKAFHAHTQEQKLKCCLNVRAAHFLTVRLSKLALRTWMAFVSLRHLHQVATNHRRHKLLKHAMTSLIKWKQPHVEFRDLEDDKCLQETMSMYRRLHAVETAPGLQQPVTFSALHVRAQPRRPAFLYDDGAQPNNRASQGYASQGYATREDRRSGTLTSSGDPNLVAKEVQWMEQILLDYEEMKIQIIERRAQLALLLGERQPGLNNGADPEEQNILLLQQEIQSLEGKKMVQMPLIHAILSRVQDIRIRNVCAA